MYQYKNHFDIWQAILEEERAIVRLLGREAVDRVVPRFMTILGGDAASLFEEDFCKASGCPPGKLKDFLAAKWNQHYAGRIARLEETAGRFPILLIRRQDLIYSLEVWSPKDLGDALIVAPMTRELGTRTWRNFWRS